MNAKFKIKLILATACLIIIVGFCSTTVAAPAQSGACPAGLDSTIKKLADAECSSCHGSDGVSDSDDIPNLAGQQSLYIRAWLAGCRKQGEQCEDHKDSVSKFNNIEIVNLSEFYAHLPARR